MSEERHNSRSVVSAVREKTKEDMGQYIKEKEKVGTFDLQWTHPRINRDFYVEVSFRNSYFHKCFDAKSSTVLVSAWISGCPVVISLLK